MRRYLLIALVLLVAMAALGVAFVPSYTLRGNVVDDVPLQGGGYELRGGARP